MSRTWVGLPAIKPHAFNGPANDKAETMELLDERDRAMPGSEHKGKLLLTFTWLLSTCSLLPFGKFIRRDSERRGDLLSLFPSFHIQRRCLQAGSMTWPPGNRLSKKRRLGHGFSHFMELTLVSTLMCNWSWPSHTFFPLYLPRSTFLLVLFQHFQIPSRTEQFVWLSSSIILLAVTAIFGFVYLSHLGIAAIGPQTSKLTPLLAVIYILARITLFVLGFTTLRGLPPQALNSITTHWPHFLLIFTGN